MVATKGRPALRENLPHSLVHRSLSLRRRFLPPHLQQRPLLNSLLQERLCRQLAATLRPSAYSIGSYNKVFACEWLNNDTVLLATKCNNLLRLNLLNSAVTRVPLLGMPGRSPGLPNLPVVINDGGLHALETNGPATFLATGALADGDLGVYELPDLRPYALLHGAHADWVFDAAWLDAATLVSVARDSSMAIWSLPEANFSTGVDPDGFAVTSPRYVRKVRDFQDQSARLRSVDIGKCGNLAVLSLNSFLQFYSIERLDTPVATIHLGSSESSFAKETVCVRASPEPHCFYSCCVDHVTLYDSRTGLASDSIESKDRLSGVRSLACNGPVVSYGTGIGNVYFYDVRSHRHLTRHLGLCKAALPGDQQQQARQHQLFRDHNYLHGSQPEYAIYSHKYDADCARIFTAGGPLATTHWGNVAVLHS
ncbi:hypothetical protein BOX15_Mlig012169g1 [Macrostomum lignano]|uniref:DDB1- and CUL4-associated factor 12 beta-propeller domain-containing protein n=2 Tax=Macrostomum lignano TaxID=282301 RepID=A0A267FYV8_9PLAT|nr:hypothetical protein BOX15_Mlig012169g1 [Macrostomum lignano]